MNNNNQTHDSQNRPYIPDNSLWENTNESDSLGPEPNVNISNPQKTMAQDFQSRNPEALPPLNGQAFGQNRGPGQEERDPIYQGGPYSSANCKSQEHPAYIRNHPSPYVGNGPSGHQPNQNSSYFYTSSLPEHRVNHNTYQAVKEKKTKKSKWFRTLAASLAIILALYGSYRLGNYQSRQEIDRKLAEFKQEYNFDKIRQSSGLINSNQNLDSDPKSAVTSAHLTTVSPVVKIAEQVAPSVVTITAMVSVKSNNFFFEPQTQTFKGSGSGILYKADQDNLYIITNHHVIENGESIRVIFHDGENVAADVIGYDSRNDLGVLKVKLSDVKSTNIKLATFGDSTKLKVGQLAVAIGNPLGEGHDHTITSGVISSVNRTLSIENTKNLEVIQTDAAINPGNSGGALVNEFSEVIGINTAKYSDVKVEGMGFAIPSSVAIPVIEKIMKNGSGDVAYVIEDERPFLGIGFSNITRDIYEETGVSFGVYVTKVYPGGAAAQAGVEVGDILFSINGNRIKDATMLFDTIGKLALGETIKLGLVRNDKVFEVETVITSFGEVNQKNNNQLLHDPAE